MHYIRNIFLMLSDIAKQLAYSLLHGKVQFRLLNVSQDAEVPRFFDAADGNEGLTERAKLL